MIEEILASAIARIYTFCDRPDVTLDKAWFPLTGRWLGFADASIAISPADGSCTAPPLVAGPLAGGTRLAGFSGRWLARDGLILTAVTVRAADRLNCRVPGFRWPGRLYHRGHASPG